ncbi:hypothetical protein ACQ5SO_15715 [Rhodovulum sp. DZ06]|uniref:hypothetical protein n=1 Tax=Rhodovulum sp. DZ06 TaxID=3425126 RepID=UPI003D354DC8
MRFKSARLLASTLLVAAAVAGCAQSPEKREETRLARLNYFFPSPAEQQGLHFVYAIESFGFFSNLEIGFYPDAVTQAEVMARADAYCARQTASRATDKARLKYEPKDGPVELADGTTRDMRTIWVTCLPE